jgi:alpha-methylacyl-CoA racemase
MMLADMGADIIRIDRKLPPSDRDPSKNIIHRGRRSIALDLKNPESVALVLRLIESTDALIEGNRPGVMEKLGLGPDVCLETNPRMIYGRMTGWGQTGPLAPFAGHDINYTALTGALHSTGTADQPIPALNLIGDYGGGGMMLAFGIACALWESARSGQGQVIDAAMIDGASILMSLPYAFSAAGEWSQQRGENWLDGGSAFYGTYVCADDKWVSVGSLEPQFYELFLRHLGLASEDLGNRWDKSLWHKQREKVATVFKTKTRQQWCAIMEGTDICFAPVLDLQEAPSHPHNLSRGTFVEVNGVCQPAPAPRFSRTVAEIQCPPPSPGQDNETALSDWGFKEAELFELKTAGVL